jgi:hypothetical protein
MSGSPVPPQLESKLAMQNNKSVKPDWVEGAKLYIGPPFLARMVDLSIIM